MEIKHGLAAALVLCALGGLSARAEDKVDFETQVKPILERSCVACHNAEDENGALRLDDRELALQGGDSGPSVVPSKPDESVLLERISLDPDDPMIMPAEGDPLSKEEIDLIRRWILEGANWPDDLVLKDPKAVARPEEPADAAGLPISDAEKAAVEQVQKRALALRLAQNTNWLRVDFSLSSEPVQDADLAALKDITNLYELDLGGTQITDAGLEHLREAQNLRRLHLEKTAVTDAGLAHLSGLEKLTYLNLYGTKVTDAGLEHLKGLKNLEKLYVWQSEVTPEGAKKLLESLPDLMVNLGLEQIVQPTEVAEAPGEQPAEEAPAEETPNEKPDEAKPEEAKPEDAKPEAENKPEEEKKDEPAAEAPASEQPAESPPETPEAATPEKPEQN